PIFFRKQMKRKIISSVFSAATLSIFVTFRFRYNFRLDKHTFIMVFHLIEEHIPKSSIPALFQLATVLRFLAVGSFQRVIGKDSDLALSRTTVCKILWDVLPLMERILCPKFIKFDQTNEAIIKSKTHFYNKYGIPGVIGCIDGTHIKKIIKPNEGESHYLNRKGYFSINATIICDYNLRILFVDAVMPGATHDSFAWNMSLAREFLQQKYDSGVRGSWLLGDSGYPLEPFVLTPYRSPAAGTGQHLFNLRHASARNVVERTIGVLKSRFRSLQGCLLYHPLKVSRIINVCCALQNLCRDRNDPDFDVEMYNNQNDASEEDVNEV
ncbi:hypothetical protein KR084_009548, partial [Drosophila pseudotakahashii]